MMPTSFIAPQLFSYMIKHDKESGFLYFTTNQMHHLFFNMLY